MYLSFREEAFFLPLNQQKQAGFQFIFFKAD